MTDILQELLGVSRTGLATAFIVFLRIGAAMAILPAFGERSIPERVRLVLALCFTVIVAPAVLPSVQPLLESGLYNPIILFSEVAVGLTIGIGLRLFVLALQIAGSIAAQSTSLSQIFGAAGVDPQPAIGHLMLVGGLALAVSTGLHVHIAELMIHSYDVFEPGKLFSADAFSTWGVARISRAFSLAFSLAAPFVVASLIYNIALGVINRAMPQLMVAFVGAPAITAGGLFLLFISLPILLSVWMAAFEVFLNDPFGAVD